MYKVKVNSKYTFDVDFKKDGCLINDQAFVADQVQLNRSTFHLIRDNQSYNAEIIEVIAEEKVCSVRVNGRTYRVEVKDQYDQLLQKLGMDNMASMRIAELKAPMPGLVLNILVKEGEQIKKGDNLLVLEAMKMENILKSPADLTVKSIRVSPGDKVEKNQIMLVFE